MSLDLFDERLYDLMNEKIRNKTISEEEIRTYSYLIEPNNFYQNYTASCSFLREFKDDLDWQQICMWQLPPEKFVWEMEDYIYFNELLCNHPNDYSEDFYIKYFKFYFNKEKYLFYNEHRYQSVPKEEYKKQIGSVGQAIDHGLALPATVKIKLFYKYELKQNISKWADRITYEHPECYKYKRRFK